MTVHSRKYMLCQLLILMMAATFFDQVAACNWTTNDCDRLSEENESVVSMVRYNSVRAAVNLDGRTKVVDGVEYHLLSILFTPLSELHVQDDSCSVWMLNGQRIREISLSKNSKHADPVRWFSEPNLGLITFWAHFDKSEELELLFGVVNLAETKKETLENPSLLRKHLLRKFVPFTAKKLPVKKADDYKQLLGELNTLSQRRLQQSIYSVAHINGLSKEKNGERYYLTAIHCDPYVGLDVGATYGSALTIRGENGGGDYEYASLDDIGLQGNLPIGLTCVWLKATEPGEAITLFFGSVRFNGLGSKSTNPKWAIAIESRLSEEYLGAQTSIKQMPRVDARSVKELVSKIQDLLMDDRLLPSSVKPPIKSVGKTSNR